MKKITLKQHRKTFKNGNEAQRFYKEISKIADEALMFPTDNNKFRVCWSEIIVLVEY